VLNAVVIISGKQWQVEVARTAAELATGLSGRASLLPGHGMLFDLGTERIVTVSAENMLFPLSVIFIGANLKVTEVALLLAPGDWGTTSLPCRYFLEVNQNEASGVAPGDSVIIQGYSPPTQLNLTLVLSAMVGLVVVAMMARTITKTP